MEILLIKITAEQQGRRRAAISTLMVPDTQRKLAIFPLIEGRNRQVVLLSPVSNQETKIVKHIFSSGKLLGGVFGEGQTVTFTRGRFTNVVTQR